MNPLVSVIIPAYNRAALIGESLESVYAQTYEPLEVIVVDDGSTDDLESALSPYLRQGLRLIRHETNKGAPTARNAGIAEAKGEFIAFLDSDDLWEPDKTKQQVRKIVESGPDTALVYSGIRKIDQDGKLLGFKNPVKKGSIYLDLLANNWIGSTSTALVRASALSRVGGFDATLRSRQDLDLWLRISREFTIDFVADPLVLYRVHTNRISSNVDSRIQGYESLLSKYFDDIVRHPKIHADYLYQIGFFYRKKGDLKQAYSLLKRSLATWLAPKTLYYCVDVMLRIRRGPSSHA